MPYSDQSIFHEFLISDKKLCLTVFRVLLNLELPLGLHFLVNLSLNNELSELLWNSNSQIFIDTLRDFTSKNIAAFVFLLQNFAKNPLIKESISSTLLKQLLLLTNVKENSKNILYIINDLSTCEITANSFTTSFIPLLENDMAFLSVSIIHNCMFYYNFRVSEICRTLYVPYLCRFLFNSSFVFDVEESVFNDTPLCLINQQHFILLLNTLILFCQERESRRFLYDLNIYPLLREHHKISDVNIKDKTEVLVELIMRENHFAT